MTAATPTSTSTLSPADPADPADPARAATTTTTRTRTRIRTEPTLPTLPRLPVAVPVVAALLVVALYALAAVSLTGQWVDQGDLVIYLHAARVLVAHESLYFTPLHHNWWTYPPFAALVFVPLTHLPGNAVRALFLTGNAALLPTVVALCLRGLGHRLDAATRRWVVLLAAAGLALQPVLDSVRLGQVNTALMALVLADVVLLRRTRAHGVLIGVATAVKLVPGLFIVYLLLTRRLRAAAVAAGTVLLSVLAGFVLAPTASADYWLRATVLDTSRVGPLTSRDAQSLRSSLVRLLGPGDTTSAVWLVLALLTTAVGLLAAAALARRGSDLAGVTVTGLVACTVSPFSWAHHWVWFLPLLVIAVHHAARAGRRSAWLVPAGLWAATAAWVVRAPVAPRVQPLLGLVLVPRAGVARLVAGSLYPLLAYLVLAGVLVLLCRVRRRRG